MSALNKQNPQFNIMDVNAAQLTKTLSEHQNTLIKLALIVLTLIGMGMIFKDHQDKDMDLRAQISQAQDKLNAIKSRDQADQDLKNFQSSLPSKLNEIELISLMSNYAKSYHVTISSLTPAENKDMGLYDLINVSFNARSDDFRNMMLFLKKIETSTFPLRVDTWSGHEEESGQVVFSIEINAVLIHK